ncbi:MAG: hypothetical protein ABGZ17_26395, partial [Planctomycetaceae bacterium]
MLDNTTKPNSKTEQPPEPRELLQLDCNRQLMIARFSQCGRMLLGGGYDATLRRWKLIGEKVTANATDKSAAKTTDKPVQKSVPKSVEADRVDGHHGWVTCLEVQPGGELVFSADSWGRLQATRAMADTPTVAWH